MRRRRGVRAFKTSGARSLALIHAAAEEVRAGELDAQAALEVLTATLTELVVGPGS